MSANKQQDEEYVEDFDEEEDEEMLDDEEGAYEVEGEDGYDDAEGEEEGDEEDEAGPESTSRQAAAAASDDYDGKVEDVDEDDEEEDGKGEEDAEEEEEEEEEEVAQPWKGLSSLPEVKEVVELLSELKEAGRKQATVLLLGKGGVGKSSLVNSLLGEALARVSAFKLQADTEIITPFLKQVEQPGPAQGFRLKLIDTVGLEDPEAGDTVNYAALRKIADEVEGKPIDVVLYVDRLDLYRVEPLDRAILGAITETFGRGIWKNTVIVLTHGNMAQPPPGTTFDSFADRRIKLLRGAIRTLLSRPRLPAVLAENSETCPADKDGKRVLPDESLWLVSLMSEVVDVALARKPYVYRKWMTQRPNNKYKWLLPVVAYGQYMLWKTVLQPRLQKDWDAQAQADEAVWDKKARLRKRLGIGPPLRPTGDNVWRLEQMYEDD